MHRGVQGLCRHRQECLCHRQEARAGYGWDAVTETLPVFVGRRELTSHA